MHSCEDDDATVDPPTTRRDPVNAERKAWPGFAEHKSMAAARRSGATLVADREGIIVNKMMEKGTISKRLLAT